MNRDEASRLIADVDGRDHAERTERLIELVGLMPEDGMIGFSGQAGELLFDDVKATWLYGCFTSTVVTAHAFCLIQVGGGIRLFRDDPSLPAEAISLEHLAALAGRSWRAGYRSPGRSSIETTGTGRIPQSTVQSKSRASKTTSPRRRPLVGIIRSSSTLEAPCRRQRRGCCTSEIPAAERTSGLNAYPSTTGAPVGCRSDDLVGRVRPGGEWRSVSGGVRLSQLRQGHLAIGQPEHPSVHGLLAGHKARRLRRRVEDLTVAYEPAIRPHDDFVLRSAVVPVQHGASWEDTGSHEVLQSPRVNPLRRA